MAATIDDVMDDFFLNSRTPKEKFVFYKKAIESAETLKNHLKFDLNYEKREKEKALNEQIAKTLNDLAEKTGCKVDGITIELKYGPSVEDPLKSEYVVKTNIDMKPEFI